MVTVVLLFLWRDRIEKVVYPTQVPAAPATTTPDATGVLLVADIKAEPILPADRLYYSAFYDSLGLVLANDGNRDTRIVDTTEKFRRFQAGSLDLAIELKKVGAYPGLGEAIDKAFALAVWGGDPATLRSPADVAKALEEGLTPRPMTKAVGERIRACCAALAWKFGINGG